MHNFTVAIISGSYMFQLHSSHHQAVYVRFTKPNHIPAVYIQLKMICGRYLSITYVVTFTVFWKFQSEGHC